MVNNENIEVLKHWKNWKIEKIDILRKIEILILTLKTLNIELISMLKFLKHWYRIELQCQFLCYWKHWIETNVNVSADPYSTVSIFWLLWGTINLLLLTQRMFFTEVLETIRNLIMFTHKEYCTYNKLTINIIFAKVHIHQWKLISLWRFRKVQMALYEVTIFTEVPINKWDHQLNC